MDKLAMCCSAEIKNKSVDTDHVKGKSRGSSQSKELEEFLEIFFFRI